MQALALTATTPLLLEDTVYALRSVGSPELVISEQGVNSTLALATLAPTAAVPETARFRFVADTSELGCVFLETLRLGAVPGVPSGVAVRLHLDPATKALVWKFVSHLNYRAGVPEVTFCPEAAADGRGMVLRLRADRTQVLRVVNGQLALATAAGASSAFGSTVAFQAVALAPLAGITVPTVSFAPEMFRGGEVTAGTLLKLQVEASSPDGIESVTFLDDIARGLDTPEELAVRTTAPYTVDWTPTVGRHRIFFRVRSRLGVVTVSDGTDVYATGPNVAPRVLLFASPTAAAGLVDVYFGAQDPDGRLARVELLEGSDVIFRRNTAAITSIGGEQVWLEAGSRVLTVRATDDLGAVKLSAPVTVTVAAPALPTPDARWLSPTQGGVVPSDVPLRVRASAQVAASRGFASASLIAVRDGERIERVLSTQTAAINVSSQEFQFELKPGTLAPGSYSLYFAPRTAEYYGLATSTGRSAPLRLTVRDPASAPALTLVAPEQAALNAPLSLGIAGLLNTGTDPVVRVDFLDDSGLIGSDATAPYTLDWQGRTVGSQALQARAVLRSGAVLTSDLRFIQVQRTGNRLPSVSIVSPTAGAFAGPEGGVTVTVDATDADGGVQAVYLYDGDTLLEATRQPDLTGGRWQLSVRLPTGARTLVARALDNDREFGSSAPVTFTVGNQNPTVGLQAPTSAVAGQLVALSSTPGDADGVVIKVDFYDGTRLIGTRYRYPWAISWLATPGVHAFTAKVADAQGAEGISAVRTMNVKASNNPPKIGLAGVTNGAILVPGTPVTLTTTPGDADGWITRVDFYDGASLIGSRTSRPWTLDWVPTAGTHVLSVQATDNDGAVSAPASVTVSAKTGANTLPKARITAPAAGTVVSAGAVVTLTSNPGDVDGWITRLEFYDGATLIGTRTTKPWAIDWIGVAGAHALSVKVFDNEGASSTSAPVSITVTP